MGRANGDHCRRLFAEPDADEQLVLNRKIDVGGKGLGAFDISFVDPRIELYILADRTNASVDLVNSEDGQLHRAVSAPYAQRQSGATDFCFQGVVLNPATGAANNNLSGPDGDVVVDHKEIWAGDGDSKIKVIDHCHEVVRHDDLDWRQVPG